MSYFSKKEQIVVVIIIIAIFAVSGLNFMNKRYSIAKKGIDKGDIIEDSIMEMEKGVETSEEQYIMVHISGAVINPGIIELKSGSRVIDAVNLAGGLKNNADSDRINLARKLTDEEKIYIPKIGEDELPDEVSNLGSSYNSGKVNINSCSKEELVSLPGIGSVLADRILEYRKQHRFEAIEDIMNVSGIGDKKFDNIKELIIIK